MSTLQNIYVVEDDSASRLSLETLVRAMGYSVLSFNSAEDFLHSVGNLKGPACVIVDVRLPGMSGIELLEALSKHGGFFSTIIVTAFADTPLTVRAIRSGAVTVLDKPFSDQQLSESISQALRLAQERCETHARMEDVRQRLAGLTKEEHEILKMLMAGKPNKAMANELQLSIRTIENRRRQLYSKMSTYSVPELVQMVVELNIRDESRKTASV